MSGLRKRTARMPSAKMPSSRFQPNRLESKRMDSGISPGERYRTASSGLAGVKLTTEEADAILEELAHKDSTSKMTWSRLAVERFLSSYAWYFPGKDKPEGPSLSKAWAYYEHVTLPRHFVGEGASDTVLRRAEPGEHEADTELYDHLRLKQSTLIEWGTGIDLYFISLRFFAVLMLICGLINVPGIMYYATGDYNGGVERDVSLPLKGSAVCTNEDWVVCTDCEFSDWDRDKTRIATATNSTGAVVTLAKRHFCEGATPENAYTNFATLLFVLFAIGLFSYYLRLREIRFDEDKVTSTDYSVVVHNPPPDALDPDKWMEFFTQFATDGDQVTAVTVALDNHMLVRKLLNRRIFSNQLKAKLPIGTDLEDEDAVRVAVDNYNQEHAEQESGCVGKMLDCLVIPLLNMFNMMLPPDDLVDKIATLTEEIKELQEEKYDATEVYVTFETEEGQRTALDALKVGLIDLYMNRTGAVSPECVFEGQVLSVEEPTEPNAVRWLDLSYGLAEKLVRRLIALTVTIGMIAIAGFAVSKARSTAGVWLSGPLTTVFNSTIPPVIKILMIIEPHATEGAYQASLYLKITLFRWTLSAILAQLITPVTSTLGTASTDLLPTTYAILLSDVWLSPLLRLSDWMTNLQKHVLAPRAKTQDEMNLNFQGTYYNLGERYTDFTKVLFVVFFYSALFPTGFFFGFLILTFTYFVDKFSLVRIWGWTPLIGAELAVFSRRFFFTGAALALAIVSSFAWAQFPYDNLCDPHAEDARDGFSGNYENAVDADGNIVGSVVVEQDTNSVFCDQSFRSYNGFAFPPTPRIQTDDGSWTAKVDADDVTWMDSTQERITEIYGWFAVGISLVFLITLFGRALSGAIVSIFVGTYEPEGDSQHIDFSSNPEIFAYVPQIKLVGQPFPYLACDIDEIDQGLIGWNDPARSYDHYNLIFEVPHKSLRRTKIIEDNTRGTATIAGQSSYNEYGRPQKTESGFEVNETATLQRPIYSVIRHYPTKWQIALAEKEAQEG